MNRQLNSVCEKPIFEKVFKDYSKMIRNFIYLKCGNIDQAEDLTQDAFVKLWQNCAKIPTDKAKYFLFTTIKNAFLNEITHQKVVLKYKNSIGNAVNREDPEFILNEKEFHEELSNAINNLTEKERVVFLLNRIEKKKYKEIAEILDISIKTVEKRMHSALLNLRKNIKNYKL